ncbi:TetR family transcriptional regulator [Streptomyces sp. H27-D2]|uniref:TetR family transcriptional regulator n=1 Tax=Streptomyces sp. H27-D2 TaxID=3046304 RepID=UPI002DBAAAF4|nr:TetR family transcriptional regulator [Streptomyces sp. H27-D2]MEC4015043.1 TetR family transcriptional regulator [Streptomyces sp. H27-D2]
MRQTRAERTRQTLIAAAATQFDQQGYAGTSLSGVTRTAGVTMGALTFHFPAKADLADAVCAEGETATREALAHVMTDRTPGLRSVIELTLELTRLLEDEVSVRAAARLAQERATAHAHWHAVWTEALHELLRKVRAAKGLQVDAEELELLAVYLMAGAEAFIRSGHKGTNVQEQLSCLWVLVLAGVPGAAGEILRAPPRR